MAGKRVVVVGSGLGGLACGIILSRNGYDVTIAEQGAQIGGCLQCFTRRGARFETGMHFIGSAAPGQPMYTMMRYLGLEGEVKLSELDTDGYNVVTLGDDAFRIPNGRDAFISRMGEYFPGEEDAARRYMDAVGRVAGASPLVSVSGAEANSVAQAEYQQRSIDEVIGSLTTNETMAKVLVGDSPLYSAVKGRTPFSIHAFIADFYNQSSYRIAGGSDTIARAMARQIEERGGKLMTNSKVTRIICDATHATAVEINGEETIECDYVISDAHPARTLDLLETKLIRPAFRHRICGLPQTMGCFAVYIHFREGAAKYMNHNHFHYDTAARPSAPWGCENYTDAEWPLNYLYMHFSDEPHPAYAKTGVLLAYMRMEEVAKWAGTKVGRRGADYEEFKRKKAEKLISLAQRMHPELRDGALHYYTSTPLTYLDYTGTADGSMYGVAKDITLGPGGRVPHRTKIPNVFQTGQSINSHGMLGVLAGAIVTCREFVSEEEIYRQINAAGRE